MQELTHTLMRLLLFLSALGLVEIPVIRRAGGLGSLKVYCGCMNEREVRLDQAVINQNVCDSG